MASALKEREYFNIKKYKPTKEEVEATVTETTVRARLEEQNNLIYQAQIENILAKKLHIVKTRRKHMYYSSNNVTNCWKKKLKDKQILRP